MSGARRPPRGRRSGRFPLSQRASPGFTGSRCEVIVTLILPTTTRSPVSSNGIDFFWPSTLTSRILWVQLEHGEAGYQRLLHEVSPELRESLELGVNKAAWYPFEQFVELNAVLDRLYGKGDLALVKELGRHGADANLTTIYRLFYKVGTTHWILGRAVRLWSAHYDSGFLEVLTRGPRTAVLRVRGFATPERVHCLSVMGWCERSIELSGGKRVRVTEPLCRTRGDELCQIEVAWD